MKTNKDSDRVKNEFEIYFDGGYGFGPVEDGHPCTYSMGVCKLEYDEKKKVLMVHLRRPGLLIGKAGRTIDGLKKFLECDVRITEVKKF